jgi:high-affinity iron transporter
MFNAARPIHSMSLTIAFQILAGSVLGFLIAAAVGAIFLAIWFTQASNLWQRSEELCEGSLFVTLIVIYFFNREP